MSSENNSSVSSSQQENRKLSEDEDVKTRKGVKTSQRLAQTQTGFSSPNLALLLELCATMTGMWEVALAGVVYGQPGR